jgi:DNA-3-methyladenine glycosylase II
MAGGIPVHRRVGDGLPEVKNPRLRALADAALAGDPDAARLRAMPSDDAMA